MGQNRHKHLILPKGRSLCWCGHPAPLGVPCTSGWRCWTPGPGCRSARPAWCPPDSRTGVPGDRRLPHSLFHLLFQQPAEGIVQLYFTSMLLPGMRALGAGGSQAALPSQCCLESSEHGLGKNNPEPVHSILMRTPCLTGSPSTVPTTSTGS